MVQIEIFSNILLLSLLCLAHPFIYLITTSLHHKLNETQCVFARSWPPVTAGVRLLPNNGAPIIEHQCLWCVLICFDLNKTVFVIKGEILNACICSGVLLKKPGPEALVLTM